MIRLWVFNRFQATFFAIGALWGFSSLLGYSVKPVDWIIVPLLATCVYQLNRLSDFEEDHLNYPEDAKSAMENRRFILFASIGSFLGTLLLGLLYSNAAGIVMISSLLLLGYLYSFPTIGNNPRLRIKDLFIGKNLAPAIGWAATVCLYPVVNAGRNLDLEVLSCFAAILVGSFLLEIICDVRDYVGDKQANIKSIPVQLGLGRTKLIINVLNTVSGLAVLIAVIFEILPLPWILLFINNVFVGFIANVMFDRLTSNRLISHSLIFFQIVLVCVLGIVT
ncbi:MAG: UbiA family prenyltransferase [Fimbriimonadaceae bacterium]|nr:UbiA family prenyltransferase [Alphaproteobacteria bacterium]